MSLLHSFSLRRRPFAKSRRALSMALLISLSLVHCKQEATTQDASVTGDEGTVQVADNASKALPLYASEFFEATRDEHFHVLVRPSPAPIPFQQLFSLDVQIFQDAERRPVHAQVSLDDVRSTMPAHNHGMNVKPIIKPHPDGTVGKFLVEGMRYHMRGDGEDGLWVLELVIQDSQQGLIDRATISTPCCKL